MQSNSPNRRSNAIGQFGRLCKETFALAFRLLLTPKTLRWIPHILTEGVAPVRRVLRLKFIEVHNMREIKNLLAGGVPLTFVTSFPRSGNTWMRYLLSDVFLQNEAIETTTELVIHPDAIITDFYCSRVAARNKAVRTPGVLLKTHDSFAELRKRFWGKRYRTEQSFRHCRHLYLYRSPEDALVSLYHYHLQEQFAVDKCLKEDGRLEIDTFCREALPGWIGHLTGYVEAAEKGVPIYFVSYEQLLGDPKRVLGETLQWLGVPHTASMLERAASNMQFQKLKATDARDMGNHGSSGAGTAQLAAPTIEFIRANSAALMGRANGRMGPPPEVLEMARVPAEFSPATELRSGSPNPRTMTFPPRAA